MVTEKKTLPHSRVHLKLTANAEQFSKAFEQELAEVSKDIQIEGFRKGKAPRAKVIEKVSRQRVEAGALDRVISDTYYAALKEEKLVPVSQPEIDLEKYAAPGEKAGDIDVVATFSAEFDIIPEVKIDGYKKIKIKKLKDPEVTEEEVDRVIEYLRKQQAKITPAESDTVLVMGMWVDLSYEGSVDGVKRTDMVNTNHPLVVGEGQLIPGFEEAIVGMKAGETKTITLTFPKDYHAKELAAKKAEFVVTVNEIKNLELPEKDDEFAKHFGHDTWKALDEAIGQNLIDEKKHEQVHELEDQVLEELLKIAKFETPAGLVEQEVERLLKESSTRLQQMNVTLDAYLAQVGKTMDELKGEMRQQAEKNVRVGLALGKVIQEEEIPDNEHAGHDAVHRLVEIATA